jgi:hypothetical protein
MKLQTTLAVCAGLLFASPAAAGTIVTTYTGYVQNGVDNAGYWGLGAGASLGGQSFTAIFTTDDQAPGASVFVDSIVSSVDGYGVTHGVLTINGQTRSFASGYGGHALYSDAGDYSVFSTIQDYSQHYDAALDRLFYAVASLTLQGNGSAGSIDPDYKSPLDMAQTPLFQLQGTAQDADYSYDYATGTTTETVNWTAVLRPSRVVSTYTAGTGSVPEPATWALMLIGFMGAGASLRRRRALNA